MLEQCDAQEHGVFVGLDKLPHNHLVRVLLRGPRLSTLVRRGVAFADRRLQCYVVKRSLVSREPVTFLHNDIGH